METRTIKHDGMISDIKEHKHPETGHNYWHPVDRIHTDEQPFELAGKNMLNTETGTLPSVSTMIDDEEQDQIYESREKVYVCISCKKPCVMTTSKQPYGCLSCHKHKNSQWKETNIVIEI